MWWYWQPTSYPRVAHLDARLACPYPCSVALSALGKRHKAHWPELQAAEFGWCSCKSILPSTPNQQKATRRAGCKVISWAPHCKTPPASPLFLSFSSLIPTFCRPAARTVCEFPTFLHPSFPRKLCITLTPVRTYASAKKKKMPPKKAVKEEKLLLGRPGNSLTSGIVSERPALCCCRVLTLTVVARSA
jgi:hypothetical protein